MDGIVDIFRSISKGLLADFEIVRQIPHSAESGRATEDALRGLLKKHLPSRFEVTGGFALGQGGTTSRQADILIIDALNCPRFLQTTGTGLYPIEGVVGLIEVTQNLTAKKRSLDNDKIRLFRSIPSFFNYVQDFKDSAPLGLLFAETSESSLSAQAEWLAGEWQKTNPDQRGLLPNSIFVLDKGTVLYHNAAGALHADPFDAKGVVFLEDQDTALLIWLIFTLHKFRVLLEHRIRARAREILSIRAKDQLKDNEAMANFLLNGMGAEPYFPDFSRYFTIDDLESIRKVVSNAGVIPL